MSEEAGTRNEISGTVHNALQAGTIHGNVFQGGVHHHHAPPVEWPCRVGVLPPRAHCFQQRDVGAALSTTVAWQVITGLGGVGKTQLAADIARQTWQHRQVDLLVWITASSREAVISSYAAAATKVGHYVGDRGDEEASRRFLEWLDTTDRRWLIVLDDVQNPAHLRGLWPPQQPTGRVLLTSRRRDAALIRRGQLREVGLFTPSEATDYLHAVLAERPALVEGSTALATELGLLPLALAQAAAYLLDRQLSCATYLQRFTDRRRRLAELFPDVDSLPDDHHATLATTWSLSIELADQLEPAGLARPLLELASVLDPNGIPAAVFGSLGALDHLTTRLAPTGQVHAEDAQDALHNLHRLSLVAVELDDPYRSVRVHALVQRATREQLPADDLATIARAAADALFDSWPTIARDTEYEQILRDNTDTLHAQDGDHLWDSGCHSVLFRAGRSRSRTGLASEAARYFHDLYELANEILGPDHPDTFAARSDLAASRGEAGDAAGAAAAFQALFADRLRVNGPDHPDSLIARSNLISWRGEAGDVDGAVEECEALLTDELRVLGPDHPDTLTTRSNLASWRAESGDVLRALDEFEAVLVDRVRILGPHHPDTLGTRGNLASWRGEAGNAARAAADFEELLTAVDQVLGPDHPDTLSVRSNLASWCGELGDVAEAISRFEALLADRIRILGAHHPQTLGARNNLAYWRGEAGDTAGAIVEFEILLADHSRVLGPEHPHTLTIRGNLARWRGESGDAAQAVADLEALLADQTRVLSSHHPNTWATAHNLDFWRDEVEEGRGGTVGLG
ncbi:tetratricopeptide repeat protein [Actinoalloteichus hymeniacidonis]|uniref:NB-ARC domain-containing protein n=1 Tax=Actinoalloteichus hymeniacidonis TaxID=340345 RepID=A0AAC9MW96_9PSEU|nr:tetratricopeptide repeat protein [Actinoalloteichus hymeniacidonis]AOS61978.1 NB-ARC domain-containing protein [Actinoalloteichus hymeniacidonis]MBB5910000.1 hypothetical protein [Actinoalloteichus hymeniacidonis]